MTRRPIPILIVSLGFILIGVGSLLKAVWPLIQEGSAISRHNLMDSGLVLVSGVLALLSGVYMLKKASWARWLCILWMALHVLLSFFHTPFELAVHSAMLIVLLIILCGPSGSRYFRSGVE
jgi:hypothetical protein